MKRKVENLRLQLEINGKSICISGVEGFGVLSAIVDWVKRNPASFDPTELPDQTQESFNRERLRVTFGGLDSDAEKHLGWYQQDLKVGDIVSVRVLGPGEIDDPK